jgi:hypothetical protein
VGRQRDDRRPVKVGQTTLQSLSANQEKFGFEEIALDFNHNAVPGPPSNKGDPAFIGATGKVNVLSGEGPYLRRNQVDRQRSRTRRRLSDPSLAVQLDANR